MVIESPLDLALGRAKYIQEILRRTRIDLDVEDDHRECRV
jgi:hypothetical protein